jgi:hypothetical protein
MNPFYVGLDDSKRTLVVAILRPGEREPEQREMPKEPHLIQRLFRRLTRVGVVPRLRGVAGRDHRQHLTIMPRETRGDTGGGRSSVEPQALS